MHIKLVLQYTVVYLKCPMTLCLKNNVQTLIKKYLIAKRSMHHLSFQGALMFWRRIRPRSCWLLAAGCWLTTVVAEGWSGCGNFLKKDNNEFCLINFSFQEKENLATVALQLIRVNSLKPCCCFIN